MNLNQLKYFYTVCTCGSLSEASEHLHISQPSLSSAIKALESEFGVALFTRSHYGMTLTSEGKTLLDLCRNLLSQAEQLEDIMKDLGSERTRLRLGVPPMLGSLILPSIFKDFCPLHPDITLEIVEDGRTELLYKLSENQLDMVFLLQNNSLGAKFSSINVGQLEIVCCSAKENPISKYTNVTPQILLDTPLVLFENSFFQTEKIKKWFGDRQINPNIIMQTKQLSTMLTLIRQNVAAGFVFSELARSSKEFVSISADPPMYVEVSLVWNKDFYSLGSMKKFKKYVQEKNPLTAAKECTE